MEFKTFLVSGIAGITLLVIAVTICSVAFIGGIFFFVNWIMRSSDAYRLSYEKLKSTPAIVKRLGEPIREEGFVRGKIRNGWANISFSVRGSKTGATVYVKGLKINGKWIFKKREIEFKDDPKRIALDSD